MLNTQIFKQSMRASLSVLSAVAANVVKLSVGLALAASASTASAGFSVSGSQLLDSTGKPFVMRGVNHPHAWYNYRTQAFEDIAATGANTVRVVLSDGQQFAVTTGTDLERVISMCKYNRLICVLEIHDVTGSGEKPEAGSMEIAAQFWVEHANILKGEEDYVIINIANEPYGNNLPPSTWTNGHIDAIKTIRAAGLTHTLMVDAANWGQDWEEIMLQNASTVAAADILGNTMFSVHMYQVYQTRQKIEGYLSSFINTHNLPIIIGEFGPDHQGEDVDEDSILAVAQEYGLGYLGWSWSGNSGCCTTLDLVYDFDASKLTPWGERLINGVNGIKETSVLGSVYEGYVPPPAQNCDWYGNVVPICKHQSEGWGQENQKNCLGIKTCEAQTGGGGVIGGNPSPSPEPSAVPSAVPSAIPSAVPSAMPSAEPSPTPSAQPSPGPIVGVRCEHIISNTWSDGFEGVIRISNAGSLAIDAWDVSWGYTDGSVITSSWSANVTGTGPYMASNLSWNGRVEPGKSVQLGFTATGSGLATPVTGAVCTQ